MDKEGEMKPRNLGEVRREVENMRDAIGQPVEEKIKPLVIGLRRWGIDTDSSCQGHLIHGFRYPWVDIPYEDFFEDSEQIRSQRVQARRTQELMKAWQIKSKNSWILDWIFRPHGFLRLMPQNRSRWKLRKMQKDVIEFGKFLQELPEDRFKKSSPSI